MGFNIVLASGLIVVYIMILLFLLARLGRFTEYARNMNAAMNDLNEKVAEIVAHHNNLCGVVDAIIKNNSSELSNSQKDGTDYSRRN